MKLKLPKFILEFSGHAYFHKYPMFFVYKPNIHKVRGRAVREILNVVEPGDILLRRFDGYLNSLCTGFWGHAGIYVGNNNMVHSVSAGCIKEDILNFCRADAVCILRLYAPGEQATTKALLMSQMNTPYDYEFSSTNESYYCTELVDMVHDHVFKDDYTVVAGNTLLTPDSVYSSKKVRLILQVNYKP
jgi:uncharacterized protein YycO